MKAVDANMVSLLLYPNSKAPLDPVSKQPIEGVQERLDLWIRDLDVNGERLLIPMPALAEFLVLAGDAATEYLARIHRLPRFVIREFTERAAIEFAAVTRKALDLRGNVDKDLDSRIKRGFVESTWAKVNFDRQIVAIAKVEPVSALYSTDKDVHAHARIMGLPCFHLADLPLPKPKPQMTLFEERSAEPSPLDADRTETAREKNGQ
jgi:hypothetical protein